jgi:hypothetical protein
MFYHKQWPVGSRQWVSNGFALDIPLLPLQRQKTEDRRTEDSNRLARKRILRLPSNPSRLS